MGIETGMYNALLQRPKSVAQYDNEHQAYQANALQLQGARQKMEMQAAAQQSAMQRQNALASISQGFGPDAAKNYQKLVTGGYLPEAQAYLKQMDASAQARAAADKTGVEAQAGQFKLQTSKRDQQLQMIAAMGSPEEGIAILNQQVQAGAVKPEVAGVLSRMIQADPQWKQKMIMMTIEPGKASELLMPHLQTLDAGGQKIQQSVDRMTGVPTNTGSTAVTNTPYQTGQLANTVRGQDRQAADNAASRAVQMRGQTLSDARARDFNAVQVAANDIKRSEVQQAKDLTKNSQVASFDTMLGTLDRLSNHPGLKRSVGVMGALPTMPGSDSANFQAELNTFQSQAFLPMVAQLKGMGALSDAEGKKLTAAVGALDLKMGEPAFRESVGRIIEDMSAARERLSGVPRAAPPPASPNTVRTRGGKVFTFPTAEAAAAFKREAGL